jgi:shikimate kinase
VTPGATARADRVITLCGFMGSGKSSVGRRLAEALGRPFFDSDKMVEERLERTIVDLFGSGDEPIFRAEEARTIARLVEHQPAAVIALGGGALENLQTRALVFDTTAAVFLDRPLPEILASLERLRASRPLLAGRSDDEIAALYAARVHAFARCPITVTTGAQEVEGVVVAVLAALASCGIVPQGDE